MWIIDNWYIIVGIVALIAVCIVAVVKFYDLPSDKQIKKVKEWLIWACIEAEKALQSGTGQLKLRKVWDSFCSIPAFSFVNKLITFEVFSQWVSEALEQVKKMLISNHSLAVYVYGNRAEIEVAKLKEQIQEV